MGRRGRIIPTKVKFNRDKKRSAKRTDKPKKPSNFRGAGLNFNTPSHGFDHMKKPENKGQKGK